MNTFLLFLLVAGIFVVFVAIDAKMRDEEDDWF